jgi:hypothetical protein
MPWTEEDDILTAIERGDQYDGLYPEDWAELLFCKSDLFSDWPRELRVEFLKYMANNEKYRVLILYQLNGFL